MILLALLPIAVVLVLMVGFRMGAAKAGPVGWLAAMAVAALFFGAGSKLVLLAQVKAALLALFVLYIIWMALLFYYVISEAGVIETLGAHLPALTPDRGLQALILAWGFGSFLQGISGFGVPTAIVAPMLVGLGFAAVPAVVAAGIGHAWAVTFGSLASSFLALIAATGRSGAELALPAAALLGVACFGCGAAVLLATGGRAALWRQAPALTGLGAVMSAVQYGVAALGIYPLAAATAGLAGLGASVLLARWQSRSRVGEPAAATPLSLRLALAPYLILILIVGAARLSPGLGALLNAVTIRTQFPELRTARGYVTPAESGRTISVFGHAGALLLYTALAAFALFRSTGHIAHGAGSRIARLTLRRSINPTIGTLTMVGMAVVMEHAGMTRLLAEGIGGVAGGAFPLAAPFIGALGALMTGSNTNSNVVFQNNTAALLDIAPAIILAAQTTGGALGAAFAPAKVIVGCSTVGLGGQEGGVLKATLGYGLALVLLIGIVAWVWANA
ncbi:MAG: L-lactate permease [Anaerolineales bacterium]